MEILSANGGSYPRIGDEPEQQQLRIAHAKLERGEISQEEFSQVQKQTVREIISEQLGTGLDIITDGQVTWADPISHFMKKIGGCEIDGLLRFFDTNFYFRQPVIKGELKWTSSAVADDFCFVRGISTRPVKPVVTGPYTLARSSIDKHYSSFSSLVEALTEVMKQEVAELVKSGASVIQVDEPAILQHPADFELFTHAMSELSKLKGNAELALYTYFGDAAPLYEQLIELPVDTIGLDFTYSRELPKLISELGCKQNLGLGIIDGRNTKLEVKGEVLQVAKPVLSNVKCKRVYINPSCGLEYLPKKKAFKKLQNLVEITKLLKEELG
jgi:5-methyltetrahydropteroyltriglutamate--homocysteine methyltransferase